jgi:Xaa-Pro aminopeptidase
MQQGKRLMFSVEEFRTRLERTRARLSERGVAGMLVHTPENIYYLSGYHTPGYYAYQTMLVPANPAKPPVLVVRRLEESNVREFSWIDTRRVFTDTEDPVELTAAVLRESGLDRSTLAVEKSAWFLTVANLEALARLLPGATLVDGSGVVEQGRVIKSPAEIDYIRKGARAAEAAMRAGLEATAVGRTEDEVAAEIYRAAILAGCEYTSLPQFVASGYRTSITHATWAGRRIEPGDVMYYELVGTVQRYSASLYRGATMGPPSDPIKRMSDATIAALERVMETMKPGVACGEVAEAWASTIVKAGFDRPHKRAGYSIGISFPPDWGEGHILSLKYGEKRVLEPGMVFHVPSSIRDEGVALVGNSETILVTERGAEAVTQFPRQHFVR